MTAIISAEILKKHGLKATPKRSALYELFAKKNKPLDVWEIKNSLWRLGVDINKTTIYRILTVFLKHNLIAQVELTVGKFHYELAKKNHHHHLVCLKCDRVQDIEDCGIVQLQEEIKRKFLFFVRTHKLEFFGICGKCQMGYNNY